jgi:hypothetical protein
MGFISRRLAVAGICAITLVACGGGGGGDGSAPTVSYTGSTLQATVTDGNASALAGGAFVSGDAGASANVLGTSEVVSQPVQQRSIKVASVLRSAVSKIDLRSASSAAAGTIQQESNTVSGPCGGTFSYTISVDDVTGAFNGTLSFSAYCEVPGESISGQVSFSGLIDLVTPSFTSLQFTATYLALTDGGKSFAIAGTVAFSFSGAAATVTENFAIQDGSGKVYQVQNLVITLTDTGSQKQETLSGRFYHPDHGYVDVVTTVTFVVPLGSAYPTSGSLTINGASGTKAVLTALADGTYTLDIDTDGDGSLETHLTGNWVDL